MSASGSSTPPSWSPCCSTRSCGTTCRLPTTPPPTWGQGLATELAHASVRVAFEMLELSELIAFTLPDNAASRRVMEKSGFAYADDIEHEGMPHVLYRRGPG